MKRRRENKAESPKSEIYACFLQFRNPSCPLEVNSSSIMDEELEEDSKNARKKGERLGFDLGCLDRMISDIWKVDQAACNHNENGQQMATKGQLHLLNEQLANSDLNLADMDDLVGETYSSFDEEAAIVLLSEPEKEREKNETENSVHNTPFALSLGIRIDDPKEENFDKSLPSTDYSIPKRIVDGRLGNKVVTIPCLKTTHELKRLHEKKYKLYLKPKRRKYSHINTYKRKMELLVQLEEWEALLNECSPNEPYIAVENKVDNAPPPQDFVYITKSVMPSDVEYLFDENYLVGCSCVRCTPNSCDCPKNSGGKFAYDRVGRLQFEPGKPIYECNSRCPCSLSCRNRVVQRGRTVRVTIFRTSNGCGWGVKTMDPIMKNQFVTEYVGEVLTNEEAEERGRIYDDVGQTYLFDLDYNDGDCAYTVDAKKYGNISHFINHSCDPNLCVFGVWVDTLDPQMPRIALFARREIKAGEELTFDYLMSGGESCSLPPSPAKASSKSSKRIPCNCGASNCRTYLF